MKTYYGAGLLPTGPPGLVLGLFAHDVSQAPLQLGGLQAPTKAGMEGVQEKAMQLEMDKKLQDEGEPVTLKQQEDMQIKGKSARQMVMQVTTVVVMLLFPRYSFRETTSYSLHFRIG